MSAVAAKADIGHNSKAVGELLEEQPELVFSEPGILAQLLESIEADIAKQGTDVSTEKGRKALKSLAFGIAKRKTAIDAAGKALNADLRKKIDVTDKVRREAWDKLEALQLRAKKPADDWDAAEKDKQDKITAIRTLLYTAAQIPADMTLEAVAETLELLERVEIDPALFGDLTDAAEKERTVARMSLKMARTRIEKAEADRIELERLRAEKAEAERVAAEKVAAEAKKKADDERIAAAAKRAAEEAVEAERQKAREAAAAAEKARADEQAKRDAEAAAERAAQAKVLADAEEARRQADAKAQMAIDEANRKAKAAEEALEADRRAEAAKAAAAEKAKAEQARLDAERQRNQEHRSRVMGAAKQALMDECEVSEAVAKKIVLSIVGKSIPHVTLEF